MESFGLLFMFWYGVLHAFGPDHLTAIADFSIGKNQKKTIGITMLFALGHGLALFVFARTLQSYNISDSLLAYGDSISSLVILGMGLYLLYMVFAQRIQLTKHIHNGEEHLHIWFGEEHEHNNKDVISALGIGVLMGIGGVRGMLMTLGMIEENSVNLLMVVVFALGVMLVFVSFGVVVLYINKNLLHSKQNIRRVFASVGIISVLVGSNMILG